MLRQSIAFMWNMKIKLNDDLSASHRGATSHAKMIGKNHLNLLIWMNLSSNIESRSIAKYQKYPILQYLAPVQGDFFALSVHFIWRGCDDVDNFSQKRLPEKSPIMENGAEQIQAARCRRRALPSIAWHQ